VSYHYLLAKESSFRENPDRNHLGNIRRNREAPGKVRSKGRHRRIARGPAKEGEPRRKMARRRQLKRAEDEEIMNSKHKQLCVDLLMQKNSHSVVLL